MKKKKKSYIGYILFGIPLVIAFVSVKIAMIVFIILTGIFFWKQDVDSYNVIKKH